MMSMNIDGEYFEITDNNESIVSENIARKIRDNFIPPDTSCDSSKHDVDNLKIKEGYDGQCEDFSV